MRLRTALILFSLLISLPLISKTPAETDLNLSERSVTGADLVSEGSFVFQGKVCDEVRNHGISFAISDPFKNHAYSVEFDRDGRFKMAVPMRGRVEEMYLYVDNIITVPVHPGDTINLEAIEDDWNLSSPDSATSRDVLLARILAKLLRKRYERLNHDCNSYLKETEYGKCVSAKSDSLKQRMTAGYREYVTAYSQIVDTFVAENGPLRDETYFSANRIYEPGHFVSFIKELFPTVNHSDTLLLYPSYRSFINSYLANRISPVSHGIFEIAEDSERDLHFSRIRREVSPTDFLADWADA